MNQPAERLTAKTLQRFLWLLAVEGLAVFFLTFAKPSEADSAVIAGFSLQRILLGGVTLLGCLIIILATRYFSAQNPTLDQRMQQLNAWLAAGDRLFFTIVSFLLLTLFAGWCLLFSWLFIPANLRPQIIWLGLFSLQAALLLGRVYRQTLCHGKFVEKYRLFPRFNSLDAGQKKVFWLLMGIAVLYVLLLMPSNLNGSDDMQAFSRYGGDEVVIYPILMDVMQPGETFSATLYHRFIYEDYHYGYPFYAWSMLVLLPVKLVYGSEFAEQIQINLPLLRVFVSVLPVVLACIVLVFIFTRFRNGIVSAAVFLFLLFAPGTLQNNQGFWHPDGLNLLFVCLTLYFLQRDRFNYGRNFYLAAACIGLSIATRLYGFFFVLAIGVYLLVGIARKALSWGKAIRRGVFFVLLMAAVVVFSSPFIFRSDARANMMAIMDEKSTEMREGYADDYDPRNDHRPGWDAWYPAFEDHYTEMFCFFFLIASLLFGSFFGDQRLTHWNQSRSSWRKVC